jgi:hypothetical protein
VPTLIFPLVVNGLTVEKITHGGQLGAPFSQMDCVTTTLGNPCIRGQWQHTRHYQGPGNPSDVIDMDFHSIAPKGCFDTLACACLGCCDPANGAFIPPTIGPLIHKFQLCNPDDHKVCGPQPRPAPANAIIFTGLGVLTPEVGGIPNGKGAHWVVFRVYIEDRSEPGGFHPNGSVEPADIYCFQAWDSGIRITRRPDCQNLMRSFREALTLDSCDFLNALSDGGVHGAYGPGLHIGALPNPSVLGVPANIVDCGALHDGNHQIHPATGADCNNTTAAASTAMASLSPAVTQPRLSIQAARLNGGQVQFSLQTEPGVTCQVEYTESLSPPNWRLLQTLVGDGPVVTVTDAITNAPQRFYRVRVE